MKNTNLLKVLMPAAALLAGMSAMAQTPATAPATNQATLEALHAKAAVATTATQHAGVAREYRLQSEAFGAKAENHEKQAAQLTRAAGAAIHKWPGLASGALQKEKVAAVEARKAQREAKELADRHIRLAVETQADAAVAGQ